MGICENPRPVLLTAPDVARSRSKIHQVFELHIDSLAHDGRGVGQREGKPVFAAGALAGETVRVQQTGRNRHFDEARTVEVIKASPDRVAPRCPHFGICAGCVLQHLDAGRQIDAKQRALLDNLQSIGQVSAERTLAPLVDAAWGYRRKGRFSVRYVEKKGRVLVGFRETDPRYVVDLSVCHTVVPEVGQRIQEIAALVDALDGKRTLPQIEFIAGDDAVALVLRHLDPLSEGDIEKLRAFAATHAEIGVQWWLQSKGPDTVKLLDAATRELAYALPEFGITMPFRPTDFTQVNPHINRVLVSRALKFLGAKRNERVIDWFCGLGNFTLPLATMAGEVLGIEGSESLVARSRENLERNRAAPRVGPSLGKVQFAARNLFEMTPELLVQDGTADRWLIDPPREGAFALAKALVELHANPQLRGEWRPPSRIVYVSCNPATLARDAGLLVQNAGYRCSAAGVVNMFPHTAHVESIAVFDLE